MRTQLGNVPTPSGGGTRRRTPIRVALMAGAVVASALAVAATSTVVQAALPTCTTAVMVNCTFGGFEIDGNTYNNPTSTALDWQDSQVFGSAAYTPFYDRYNTTSDSIMSNGSKESDQTTWSCVTSKAPGKSDLGGPYYSATTPAGDPGGGDTGVTAGEFAPNGSGTPWAGSLWFENTAPGQPGNIQYLFADFQRYAVNGDVHIDYEFNKAGTLLPSGCPTLAKRSQGDLLITFDTNNGGAQIFVSAFKWVCTGNIAQGVVCPSGGSFQADNTYLTNGSTFVGTANISLSGTDAGVPAGAFGEAGLDLTHSGIGPFTCGEFGTAYMKTRSSGTSDIANGQAEVKDYVSPVPFSPGLCPTSQLSKAQKDVTTPDLGYNQDCSLADSTAGRCASGAAATPEGVKPGDTIQYQLTYHNAGGGTAPNPVVTDSIPAGTTYVASSCSGSCTTTGTPVTSLTWNLGPEPAGATVNLTFQVTVASASTTSGTVVIENHGHVTDTQVTTDTASDSNYVAASVNYAPTSNLSKAEADVQPLNQYCNTATGGAVSSNPACASLSGSVVANPTFVAGPISATPGDTIEYQLAYSNTGDSPATTVTISDTVPANSTFVAGSAAGADSPTIVCLHNTTVTSCSSSPALVTSVTWTYGSVASGGSEMVTFEVKLASTFADGSNNSVTNSGSVTTDQDNASSNSVVATVTASGALALSKSASVSGGQITYTISYYNTGNGNLAGVSISDAIPTGLKFLSCTGGCTGGTVGQNGTVTWSGLSVAAGTTAGFPAGSVTLTVGQ